MELEKLFNPASIAIVGATDEPGKVGNAICENILNLGYSGGVFLVNPRHQALLGRKCYEKLEDIPDTVDVAIIVIPGKFVPDVIRNAAQKVKNFVIISAGFSEIGEEGAKREQEILEIAEQNNLTILGPNCLGYIVPAIKLNASFASGIPRSGGISFISQSGALISAMLDIAKSENFGFSNIISIGNKMQLDESDLFEYLEKDKKTEVIAMYLEGIKDGRQFKELAARISKVKPVVILKAGKTQRAQKAITSHTGALAGSEEITKALFRKTGIIQAENFSEFLQILTLISSGKPQKNKTVAVITNAGGPGVLTTDSFDKKEIQLLEIQDDMQEAFHEFLPAESSATNPIDLLGDAQQDRYKKAIELINTSEVGSIACVLTPQENTPVDAIAETIVASKEKTEKPIVAVFLGKEKVKKGKLLFKKSGVPSFSFPEDAIGALDKYYRWGKYKSEKTPAGKEKTGSSERKEKVGELVSDVRSQVRTVLSFSEAKKLVGIYEIPTVTHQEIDLKQELSLDFPLVLKVDSDKVFHKTEKQGVIIGITNEEELKKAYESMSEKFPGERIIIQPMEKIETEIILGIKKDESVGPVVVFGLGGIYTEVFKMVDFVIPPATPEEIKSILVKSPVQFLFKETRGQKKYDIEEITRIIYQLSLLAEEIDDIRELDINPLLIYNDGRKAIAVDVKIII